MPSISKLGSKYYNYLTGRDKGLPSWHLNDLIRPKYICLLKRARWLSGMPFHLMVCAVWEVEFGSVGFNRGARVYREMESDYGNPGEVWRRKKCWEALVYWVEGRWSSRMGELLNLLSQDWEEQRLGKPRFEFTSAGRFRDKKEGVWLCEGGRADIDPLPSRWKEASDRYWRWVNAGWEGFGLGNGDLRGRDKAAEIVAIQNCWVSFNWYSYLEQELERIGDLEMEGGIL